MILEQINNRDLNQSRINTYRNDDFFKTVILARNKSTAEEKSKWLTNTPILKTDETGTYKCPFKQTFFVAYANWPGSDTWQRQATVGIDALLIFLDSETDLEEIKEEIETRYKFVNVRLLVSNETNESKVSSWTNVLKAELFKAETAANEGEQILRALDLLDQKEYQKIVEVIKRFDTDNSGVLEIREMPLLVKELGGNPDSEDLKQATLALDVNHDNILETDEFIQWWKIGRQNSKALSKIYELNMKTQNVLNQLFHINSLKKHIDCVQQEKTSQNNVNITIEAEEIEDYLTRICFKLATGGEKRKEATRNFLSRYTNIHDVTEDNWINIAFFVQSLTYEGYNIKEYLENFRENLINYAEKTYLPGLSNFIRDFVIFKFYPQDNSANVIFQFKSDVYSLIKDALSEVLCIRDFLTDNHKGSFVLDLKVHSCDCIGDYITQGKTLEEFLDKCEIYINSSCIKSRLRTIVMHLSDSYKPWLQLLQYLFAGNNVKMTYKGEVSHFLQDEETEDIFKINLKQLSPFIEFLNSNVHKELLKCLSRVEVGVNLYDFFLNLQIFSQTLWTTGDNNENN